jgi:hypothetical protein
VTSVVTTANPAPSPQLVENSGSPFKTAVGYQALFNNTATGLANTAIGYQALFSNTTGDYNTASGFFALRDNLTGEANTATGVGALQYNTSGSNNTASGVNSLYRNRTGSFNVALGYNAGKLLTTGDANIVISNPGIAGESNTIRIGKQGTQGATFVAGISGATVAGGVGVVVDATGHLGTVTSSARFKDAIKPMDKASEAIHALQPVTFRYKEELDPEGIPQFGLVAEQVEKVNPDLVARDADGKAYTVRYEAVNAMLLNEFIKGHKKVEEQQATIAELKKAIAHLAASDEAQAAQIQKVSDQLGARAPAPRVVAND